MNKQESLYFYKATVTRVIDGDTVELKLDLGFGTFLHEQRVRLSRINAPELHSKAGVASKLFLEALVLGKDVIVQTYKSRLKGYYGRWLGTLYLNTGDEDKPYYTDVNRYLVVKKQAIWYRNSGN